jgi:cytochrome c oxidase subunit II
MIHFFLVGILTLASSYVVYTYVLDTNILLPIQASTQAIVIDDLFNVHFALISFFFSLIVVFMLYSIVVFRQKSGENKDGEYFEGNMKLEIVWVLIPLVIVLWLAYLGSNSLAEIERRYANEMEIEVIAKQWGWSFAYPDYGIVAEELYIPVDQPVLLRMTSLDVIHSFWVPEFRVKQDILPGGEDNIKELRITPNELGQYKVRCAELCGMGHGGMTETVVVVNQTDFDLWIGSLGCGEMSDSECAGRDLAVTNCSACHTFDGTPNGLAPTWFGLFGSEVPLVGGSVVTVDEAYLIKSINEPAADIHDGFAPIMPANFGELFSDEDINSIIAYIQTLH